MLLPLGKQRRAADGPVGAGRPLSAGFIPDVASAVQPLWLRVTPAEQ